MRPLFSETSVAAVRLIIAVTFSVATIFIDSRFDALTMVRQAIKTALWPVEQIAYFPPIFVKSERLDAIPKSHYRET